MSKVIGIVTSKGLLKKLLFSSDSGVSEFTHTETLLNKKLEITLSGTTQETYIMRFTATTENKYVKSIYDQMDGSSVVMAASSIRFNFSTSTPNKVSVARVTTNISTGEESTSTSAKIIKVYEIIE